jgi:anti-sigma factor RsiW
MTDITHDEVRDALPELLHGNVDAARRAALENHLLGCDECASEMRVLQMVRAAPSFAPRIDATKVAAMIPPYGGIPAQRPAGKKIVWQMASAVAALVLVVAVVMTRGNTDSVATPTRIASVPVTNAPATTTMTPPATVPLTAETPRVVERTRELQVAVGLEGLSDGSVAQLVKDLDGLDGLPSPDPENLGVGDPASGNGGGQ